MRMPGRKFWIPLFLLAAWFGGRAWYFSPAFGEEDLAANFTAIRADGESFQLSDLKGQHVLLDFWGSWCGPCRRESPELVALNKTTQNQLTIVSIAIERDSSAWLRAITQDARDWPHQVMDQTGSLKFLGGEIASLYGVNQVPTNFLIDPDGRVIGVDIPPSEVERMLTQ